MSDKVENSLYELFKNNGIDVDEAELFDGDEMLSNIEVEAGDNRVRKMKTAFNTHYHVALPAWLEFPFNPITLEPYKRGKTITTYSMGKTPADVLRIMGEAARQSPEYKERLWKLFDIEEFLIDNRKLVRKNEDFVFDVEEDGSCSPLMGRLISKFFNFYMYDGVVQRYRLGSEFAVTKSAIIPLRPSGVPDFDNVPETLVMAYKSESELLYAEIDLIKEECEARGDTKQQMEHVVDGCKSSRIVSPPFRMTFIYGFVFNVQESQEFDAQFKDKYTSGSYKIQYAQQYFRIKPADITTLLEKVRGGNITNVNYLEVIRSYPAKDPAAGEKEGLGLCAQGAYFTAVKVDQTLELKIPDVSTQISYFLSDPKNTDREEVKKFIRELEPISSDEVVKAYSNNITQYKRALAKPEIIQHNSEFLKKCESTASLALVKHMAEVNATTITIEGTVVDAEKEMAINNDEYFDTEDGFTTDVSADAFIDAD